MIFNWILVNKLAIGTPLVHQKDQLFLKEKKLFQFWICETNLIYTK